EARTMSKFQTIALALAIAAIVSTSGCASFQSRESAANLDGVIPATWPLPATTPVADAALALPDIGWRDFFADARLQDVVALALENNRDLRVAMLNVERARAQYRIQRADRVPSVGVNAQMERIGADNPALESETYSVGLGLTAFELDLFGRVRN